MSQDLSTRRDATPAREPARLSRAQFAGSSICLGILVLVEVRAKEPMRLFRGRVFTMASILRFVDPQVRRSSGSLSGSQ